MKGCLQMRKLGHWIHLIYLVLLLSPTTHASLQCDFGLMSAEDISRLTPELIESVLPSVFRNNKSIYINDPRYSIYENKRTYSISDLRYRGSNRIPNSIFAQMIDEQELDELTKFAVAITTLDNVQEIEKSLPHTGRGTKGSGYYTHKWLLYLDLSMQLILLKVREEKRFESWFLKFAEDLITYTRWKGRDPSYAIGNLRNILGLAAEEGGISTTEKYLELLSKHGHFSIVGDFKSSSIDDYKDLSYFNLQSILRRVDATHPRGRIPYIEKFATNGIEYLRTVNDPEDLKQVMPAADAHLAMMLFPKNANLQKNARKYLERVARVTDLQALIAKADKYFLK